MINNKHLMWNDVENATFALNYETLRIATNLSFKELNTIIGNDTDKLDQDFALHLELFSKKFNIDSYYLNTIYYKIREIFYSQETSDIILIKNRTVFPYGLIDNDDSPLVLYSRGDLSLLDKDILSCFGSSKISYTSKEFIKDITSLDYALATFINPGFNNYLALEALKNNNDIIIVLNTNFYSDSKYKELISVLQEDNLILTPFSKAQKFVNTNSLISNDILIDISNFVFVGEQEDNSLVYRLVKRARNKNKTIFALNLILNNKANLWPRELEKYQIIGVDLAKEIKEKRVIKRSKEKSVQLRLL